MPTIYQRETDGDDDRIIYSIFEGYRFRYTVNYNPRYMEHAIERGVGSRAIADYTYWTCATTQALALAFVQQGSRPDYARDAGIGGMLHMLDEVIVSAIENNDRLDLIAQERYFTRAMENRPDRHEIIATMEIEFDQMRRQHLIEVVTRGVPRPEEADDTPSLEHVPADVIDWARGAIRFAVGRTARRLTFRRKE